MSRTSPTTPIRTWLVDLTYTQAGLNADVMPAAVGYIASYARHRFGERVDTRIFKYPERLAEAMEEAAAEGGAPPDLVGLSNYCWNFELGAAFARLIRRRWPDTVIVMGGPNYPEETDEQEAWLRANAGFVDYYVPHEGEQAFACVIEAMLAAADADADADDADGAVLDRRLPGVHSLDAAGAAWLPATLERMKDFGEVPSPYLDGMLDRFFDGRLGPIVQTNRGCPFQCTFCVEGAEYYRKVNRKPRRRVDDELLYIAERIAATLPGGGRNDLYIADSNFGMFKEDLQTCRTLADTRREHTWPDYINVSTGKNKKERVLEASRLIDGALRLSGAVQSLDPQVLDNVKRSNISADEILELAMEAEGIGANSYSEVILALPGDTFEKHCATLRALVDAGFSKVVVYQLAMLQGADMATQRSRREHGMRTRFRVYPRAMGHWPVGDEDTVRAVEIEEVCVEVAGLSFDEYVKARRLGLCIVIFFNDGPFLPLVRLLEKLGVSRFEWIKRIFDSATTASCPPAFADLMDRFEADTRGELYETRAELEAFLAEPGVFDRYLTGELGYNLMFTYKAMAWTQLFDDLSSLAHAAAASLIEESPHTRKFLADAAAFSGGLYSQLFQAHPVRHRSHDLHFDLPRLIGPRSPDPLHTYLWDDAPRPVTFELDDAQFATLSGFTTREGATPAGIGRMFSRTHVRKLARNVKVG